MQRTRPRANGHTGGPASASWVVDLLGIAGMLLIALGLIVLGAFLGRHRFLDARSTEAKPSTLGVATVGTSTLEIRPERPWRDALSDRADRPVDRHGGRQSLPRRSLPPATVSGTGSPLVAERPAIELNERHR